MIHGYARCSTNESKQDIDRQVRELKQAGAENIFLEYEHGDAVVKCQLSSLLEQAQAGDTIITLEVSRLARSTKQLCEINLTDYEQLAKKATEAADRFHVISEQVKQTEQAMKTNAGLKAATVQYAKTRPVFEQYKATKYSRKFLAEHEADLELYRAAQAEMRSLLGGAKLPKMDVLKEEGRKLTAKKKQLYGEYQKARRDMQEIVTIKANIDTLMGYTEPGRKQEKER